MAVGQWYAKLPMCGAKAGFMLVLPVPAEDDKLCVMVHHELYDRRQGCSRYALADGHSFADQVVEQSVVEAYLESAMLPTDRSGSQSGRN